MITLMIRKYIYIFLGIFMIFYTIYIRIIVIRMPKSLYLLDSLNYKLIIIISFGFIFSIFMLYKNLSFLLIKKEKKVTIIQKLAKKFNQFIENIFIETYQFFMAYVKNSYDKISYLTKIFYAYFGYKNETILIFISLFIKILIVLTFLIDVFLFFKLRFFYIMLYLLVIPIIINFLMFILEDFAKNLEDVKSYLKITISSNSTEFVQTFEPSEGYESIDLTYHINQYKICNEISGYLEVYNFLKSYYNIRINIIIYFLYLIGWIYVLSINYPIILVWLD